MIEVGHTMTDLLFKEGHMSGLYKFLTFTSLLALTSPTIAQTLQPKTATNSNEGSLYLQCDGNPNNMSAGESIARFIGAVTLLGVFAPATESPNSAKRKFGSAGVAACSALLDGPKAEVNIGRRLPLIVAKAIHYIEDDKYQDAINAISEARKEADLAGLSDNVYFQRSLGLSFDRIEAEALVRMGRGLQARSVSMRKIRTFPHSYYVLHKSADFYPLVREVTDDQLFQIDRLARIVRKDIWVKSSRVQLSGNFKEAARINESYLEFWNTFGEKYQPPEPLATTAVVHALNENWQLAEMRAQEARYNIELMRKDGVKFDYLPATSELLDLYDILVLVKEGEVKKARLKFSSRSDWLHITFPQRIKTIDLLQKNAEKADLVGSLSKSVEEIWEEQQSSELASLLNLGKNNNYLFELIEPYAKYEDYRRISNIVWSSRKSKIISEKPNETSGDHTMYLPNCSARTCVDGLILHAALEAKRRGFRGFRFGVSMQTANQGWVKFGALGDKGMAVDFYQDADEVINELQQIIPRPGSSR
jgi:hypothetical protein